jgi:hypothetical protein
MKDSGGSQRFIFDFYNYYLCGSGKTCLVLATSANSFNSPYYANPNWTLEDDYGASGVAADRWVCFEVYIDQTNDRWTLWVDGEQQGDPVSFYPSNYTITGTMLGGNQVGTPGSDHIIDFDDIAAGTTYIGLEGGADETAPTVTVFTIPATSNSLTVTGITFEATDAIGVTGYMLTEDASAPTADGGGWSVTAQTQYVFATEGAKTLYAWAKDAAGNVSSSLNDSVTITLGDTTAPTITAFTIPSTSSSLTVTDITFTATDAVGVTGYLLTEEPSTPSVANEDWSESTWTQYVFDSAGAKTLYAWAKDAADNISSSSNDSVTITLADETAPTITTFTIPATSNSLTVTGITFEATDAVGVTGYLISEDDATPGLDSPGWSETTLTQFIFASEGEKTLYAWAKDAAGNISTISSDSVTITLQTPGTSIRFGENTADDYSGMEDTFLNKNTTNYSTSEVLSNYIWPINTVANTSIIKQDFTGWTYSLPITATLYVYCNEAGGTDPVDIKVHRIITHDPTISAATFYTYDGENNWTNQNGAMDDAAEAEDTVSVTTDVGWKSFDITNMVTYWLSSPGSNYGLVFWAETGAADTYRYFVSSDGADGYRPYIVVTPYSDTPTIAGVSCQGVSSVVAN